MIVIALPYPPTSNHNTMVAKGRRISSPKYRNWRAAAEVAARVQAGRRKIEGPYTIHYLADRPDLRRRDVENLPKSLSDALQAAGVIRDDADCERSTIEWGARVARGCEPLVRVTIEPFSLSEIA